MLAGPLLNHNVRRFKIHDPPATGSNTCMNSLPWEQALYPAERRESASSRRDGTGLDC
jgi:hypothetical protein